MGDALTAAVKAAALESGADLVGIGQKQDVQAGGSLEPKAPVSPALHTLKRLGGVEGFFVREMASYEKALCPSPNLLTKP